MSDEITIEGREYFSSKRASELSGYAQDYIGQLARSGAIDARRIGGLWYILMDSLQSYKVKAESYIPEPPRKIEIPETDTIISFEGKNYVSAPRAAKITGYSQDYVGQLARSGKILSRQVGNRWYVDREAIVVHKHEKDALLAAVQTESVGLHKHDTNASTLKNLSYAGAGPFFTYSKDEKDLMPILREASEWIDVTGKTIHGNDVTEQALHRLPIRVTGGHGVERSQDYQHSNSGKEHRRVRKVRIHGKTIFYGSLAATALTIVIVLSFGLPTLKSGSRYTSNLPSIANSTVARSLTASASQAFGLLSGILEKWLAPELIYRRGN